MEEKKMLKENNYKLKSDINTLTFEQKLITNHEEIIGLIGVTDNKNENCVKVVVDIASKLRKQDSLIASVQEYPINQ